MDFTFQLFGQNFSINFMNKNAQTERYKKVLFRRKKLC